MLIKYICKNIKIPKKMGYHCVGPSILFYIHGSANLHFFEPLKYQKNTQIRNAPRRESGHWLT